MPTRIQWYRTNLLIRRGRCRKSQISIKLVQATSLKCHIKGPCEELDGLVARPVNARSGGRCCGDRWARPADGAVRAPEGTRNKLLVTRRVGSWPGGQWCRGSGCARLQGDGAARGTRDTRVELCSASKETLPVGVRSTREDALELERIAALLLVAAAKAQSNRV